MRIRSSYSIPENLIKSLLAIIVVGGTCCNTTPIPEWQKKNQELIDKHKLTVRQLSALPITNINSNLEAAKVTSLDKLDSTVLYPGIQGKLFWGSGNMISILQLKPNAKIPE